MIETLSPSRVASLIWSRHLCGPCLVLLADRNRLGGGHCSLAGDGGRRVSYCCPSTRCAWPGARSFDYRPALVLDPIGVGTAALVGEWRAPAPGAAMPTRPWPDAAVLAGCTAPFKALKPPHQRSGCCGQGPPASRGPLPGRLRSPSLASGIRSFSLSGTPSVDVTGNHPRIALLEHKLRPHRGTD